MDSRAPETPSPEVAEATKGYTARTIPVRVEVPMTQTVLHLEEAASLLRQAHSIALGPCECRVEKRRCTAPIDVCLSLNEGADTALSLNPGFRLVSVEEALDALCRSHEAGLVHLAYRRPGLPATMFCSCCSCCCWLLNALRHLDYHEAIVESSHQAEHRPELCQSCGQCVERCPFQAWSAGSGGKPQLNPERCFGCGVCVSHCPARAIAFVPR